MLSQGKNVFSHRRSKYHREKTSIVRLIPDSVLVIGYSVGIPTTSGLVKYDGFWDQGKLRGDIHNFCLYFNVSGRGPTLILAPNFKTIKKRNESSL